MNQQLRSDAIAAPTGTAPGSTAPSAARRRDGQAIIDTFVRDVWRNDRRKNALIVLALAAAGLLVHHSWLTTVPLAASDWVWISPQQASGWFPWPPIWDSAAGFGHVNFANANQYPILAMVGLLAHLGLSWDLSEKLFFFWPLAVLSFTAPWLFARRLLGSGWALLSAVIFAGNTYIVVIGTLQLTVAMAEVLAPLSLLAFIVLMQRSSLSLAIGAGLLFSLQFAFDVRITYLTLLMALLYLVVVTSVDFDVRRTLSRLRWGATALAVFGSTQLFWLLPYLAYSGNHGLNLPNAPWLAFMRISHGITAVFAFWNGGTPVLFNVVQANPIYFLFPLLAFIPLLTRRIRHELVWLALAAVIAAFLIKQTNPPAGWIYDWMFAHVPGWNMFREASKLFFIVALGYSILIPVGIQILLAQRGKTAVSLTLPAVIAGLGILVISATSFGPVFTGQVGFTTRAFAEPESVKVLSQMLAADASPGSVVWLAGPHFMVDNVPHTFPLSSATHGLVTVYGSGSGDPFTSFCASPEPPPYCYLSDQLFPYLLARTGTTYVIAPASPDIGVLPMGVTYSSLLTKVTAILGAPRVLGTSPEALAVWHINPKSRVEAAPYAALVEGTPRATESALPALETLNLPTIYALDGAGRTQSPEPPRVIQVLPHVAEGYAVLSSGDYVLFAGGSKNDLHVDVNGQAVAAPLLQATGTVASGLGVYGPLRLLAGYQQIVAFGGAQLGPALSWSEATKGLLTQTIPTRPVNLTVDKAEQIVGEPWSGRPFWLELRDQYDPGWNLNAPSLHLVGDGIFNLYFTTRQDLTPSFTFSSSGLERIGGALALASTILFLLLLAADQRRRLSIRDTDATRAGRPMRLDLVVFRDPARSLCIAGFALVAIGALLYAVVWLPPSQRWIGPQTGYLGGLSELWLGLGLVSLLAGIVLQLGTGIGDRLARRSGLEPTTQTVSVFKRLAVSVVLKILSWHRPTPTEAFLGDHYQRHNQRRQEHLASLALPIERRSVLEVGAGIGDHTSFFLDRSCRVVSTEGREENLAILRKRYPDIEVRLLDVQGVDPVEKQVFDVVYCYGLLYHLSRPAEAIAYMAERCGDLLLLETCVSYGDHEAINPVPEPAQNPTQSISGAGCRPTRPWVYAELRKYFDHVYMPLTQPYHGEFPIDWSRPDKSGRLTRAIFIASRTRLENARLMEGIPSRQVRG